MLDRTSRKFRCPACGHRSFVLYLDTDGKAVDMTVGRCDRLNNCQYHLPPKDFFSKNPSAPKGSLIGKPKTSRLSAPVTTVLPMRYVVKSMSCYDSNKLVVWLWNLFRRVIDRTQFDKILYEYRVGTAAKWGGSTVWWQIDPRHRMHTGKIMDYDVNSGCRVKESDGRAHVSWVHSLVKEGKAPNFDQMHCMYGAHLLTQYPQARVWVMESEKAALIFALALRAVGLYSKIVPVATGGCGGLMVDWYTRSDPDSVISVLRNRDVVLLPDDGMYTKWNEKARDLETFCHSVTINPLACREEGPKVECSRWEGDGPDDIVIRHLQRDDKNYEATAWWNLLVKL